MIHIGIPRGLYYYKYFPLWEKFFHSLGAKIILSPPTNKAILEEGSKYVVDEACLPVKVFFGHINYLKDKTDLIFAPRVVSVKKKEYTCPKFMGIPDMVRIRNLPPILGPTIDLSKKKDKLWSVIGDIGRKIDNNPLKVAKAWMEGRREIKKQQNIFQQYNFPEEFKIKRAENPGLNIAVIGHEYIIYDNYLSMNLLNKISSLNVGVYTPQMVSPNNINKEVEQLPKKIFWDFGKNALGAALFFSKQKHIKGIINISSFGCGPDSMINSMILYNLKKGNSKPVLNLTIDEHTGEAGIDTRLEAFYDLLVRRVG